MTGQHTIVLPNLKSADFFLSFFFFCVLTIMTLMHFHLSAEFAVNEVKLQISG